jgi:hypothetical protein
MTKGGLILQSMDDLLRFAKMAVESNAAPKGMNIGMAAIAIQAGMERGLGVMGGLQAAVVINGVLSWRGWAAVALIQSSGLVVPGTFKSWVEGDPYDMKANARGIATALRKGYDQPFTRTFSLADAKAAGLLTKDGPWATRRGNMLEWRAIGDLGRFHFPEPLGGVPMADDVEAGGVGPLPALDGPAPRGLMAPPALPDPLLAELTGQVVTPPAEPVQATVTEVIQPARQSVIEQAVSERGVKHDRCPRCGDDSVAMFDVCGVCAWPGNLEEPPE